MAAARPGKNLQPARRLRLRFVQKLSVRHVSNPLVPTGRTFADQLSAIKVGSKGRLPSTDLDRLKALRGPGERYSDVIVAHCRVVTEGARETEKVSRPWLAAWTAVMTRNRLRRYR